eukprot:TRINITY_DN15865_c1_g1_i1.p1 TRINITY_DN15865_c1_g1~~TRINITY_DN15865_c1_g1_i1.p1  ORF type:complete len:828 (-),score=133.92 TRINITY_DN15865_c1_g1_i1:868-3351(-)
MELDSKSRRDGHEDVAREHDNRKGNRKGNSGLDQRQGKETRKGGKADRSRGSVKAEPKGVQAAEWTKQFFTVGLAGVGPAGATVMGGGVADYDSIAASHNDERERPSYESRVGRDKTKERKDNWKDRVDLKKEAWRDRQRKPHDNGLDVRGTEYGDVSTNPSRLSGGALLSMLKVASPAVIRYTRDELLSISKLPASKVKPKLHVTIDGENTNSPLLIKTKPEKDDFEEEGVGAGGGCRTGGGFGDGPSGCSVRDSTCGGGYGFESGYGAGDWKAQPETAKHSEAQPEWATDSQWDMPDVSIKQGCLNEFTLGDIREAERSLSLGMSMSDYKASLRAAGGPNGGRGGGGRDDGANRDVMNAVMRSNPAETLGLKVKDDFFNNDNGHSPRVFVDEDEDLSCPSRGFGARLARRTGGAKQDHVPLGKVSRDQSVGNEAFPPFAKHDSSSSARPSDVFGADRDKPSNHQQQGIAVAGDSGSKTDVGASDGGASNRAGRSILTMLGRKTDTVPSSIEPPSVGSATDLTQQPDLAGRSALAGVHGATSTAVEAKLSVEALFNFAEGKDMPPIPAAPRVPHEEGIDTDKTQRDMVQMASQLMWAAAKAKQPPAQLAGMFRGCNLPSSPYGTMPSPFGLAGGGPSPTMLGREHAAAFHEAYTQAILSFGKAASLPAGRDGGKANQGPPGTTRATATAASASVPWASPAAPGYPLAPSTTAYGPPSYGQFPNVRDYGHMPRGGTYDVGSEKGASPQAAPVGLQGVYGISTSLAPQPSWGAPGVGRLPGKAGISPKSHGSGTTILSQSAAAAAPADGGADSVDEDADGDDAGCSQS